MLTMTRGETVAAGVTAAILAGIGISPAVAEPLSHDEQADREVRLAVSDGFARQMWVYRGRAWSETRDTLTFHEDETIRITIANDRPGDRVIVLGEDQMIRVRQGEIRSVVMRVASVRAFAIAVADQPMISRGVTVRAGFGARVKVA